jgi:transposase
MEDKSRSARRYHAPELKKAVLDDCRAGASVASVAMAHGLNANLVHKRRRHEQGKVVVAATTPIPAQTFIPLAITSPAPPAPIAPTPPACAEPRKLRIELRRGAIVATVSWPMSATTECAGWLRELLR